MRILDGQLVLSPSDLSSFLACRHKAGLDLAAARKVLERPETDNPYAAILRKHGEDHERAYVESLRAQGLTIVDVKPEKKTPGEESARLTVEAMRAGVDAIVQARLAERDLAGYADVLRRVERPSHLGAWSYEAQDTKLARETKGGTILQLSAYSAMLTDMQGVAPERFQVVTPIAHENYRVEDFAAYYRMVLKAMRDELAKGHEQLRAEYYPEPVDACQVCAWAVACEKRRRADDHLSYIAGSGRSHRVELVAQGVPTLKAAAEMSVPVTFKPARGSRETYDRLGSQARVQHQQRTEKRPVHELLEVKEGEGLTRLPPPSPGDVFLDLEGASFAREGGREFLFGVWGSAGTEVPALRTYTSFWAMDDGEEKAAFETVMDLIVRAWEADPQMHVYHFNHYEPTAFKKLVGRYVSRGDEMDRLLRSDRFVDLYPIVKQAVRAGVESYSIKQLEQYYNYTRKVELKNVREPLMAVEMALDAKSPDAITSEIRDAVQGYNEDDCRSTEALRDWLETLRAEWERNGTAVPRPTEPEDKASDTIAGIKAEVEVLRLALLAGLPPEASQPSDPNHPRWLLAYLVDWHKREENAQWWEYFRVLELPEEDLMDERAVVAGLRHVKRLGFKTGKTGKPTKSVIDRYCYPRQEIEVGRSDKLKTRDDESTFGKVVAHDRLAQTLDVEKGPSRADDHPETVFAADVIGTVGVQRSVMRLAERVIEAARLDGVPEECGVELLLGHAPRLRSGAFEMRPGETAQAFAVRIATDLHRTTLPIQGPPGAGKTYVGAQMILALVRAGKKVGVTANSHKVIHNLLDEVLRQAGTALDSARAREVAAVRGRVAAKVGDDHDDEGDDGIICLKGNEAPLAALMGHELDVLGGTSWLWSREEYANTVDVLFVDEAGQMSLANVLAVSQAADSLVLLGDPQQLDQPEKASHPDGVGISALQHVLGGHETMPPEKGIFLPVTWRMSPTLTAFTSELFYEGKLHAKDGLERQQLVGTGALEGSHLWLVPVEHDGNQSSSMEEVEAVAALVERLLAPGAKWVNEKGDTVPLTAADIRVVAPFNAQVNRIAERLGGTEVPPYVHGVQVGTVDKFQGQTCAVVIYSMTTSRPEDAPRGMEFLYSLNRLNVATSRARCAVFLVASPRLFEPECRTPRQMQLANAMCRYAEKAQRI